jgi:threonine/homoserine/homoserine lactone efflux protein
MVSFLLRGLGLGFAAGIQPGPLQTYFITQSLGHGWRRTLLAAFAPLLSDGPIVALVLLVLSQVPAWLQRLLYVAGGLFILYLAWAAFQNWRRMEAPTVQPPHSGGQSLFRAALTNVLSPGPYLFWSMVNGPILLQGWDEAPSHGLGFLLGFYGAMIGLNIAIILVFGLAGEVGERVRRAMLGLSALALTGFGLFQLWQGIF